MTKSRSSGSHPFLYDAAMMPMEIVWFSRWRKDLLGKAKGEVLEIGSGTGVNLRYYPDDVSCVTAVDPSRRMITRLRKRAEKEGWSRVNGRCLKTDIAPGEELPYEGSLFDTAVITLILCTVESPDVVLSEVVRTLKSGGRILFIEHQLPTERLQRRLFRSIAPIWHRPSGCNLDRLTEGTIRSRDDLREIIAYRKGPLLGYPFFIGEFKKI